MQRAFFVLIVAIVSTVIASDPNHVLQRLNRVLERRQLHEYEAGRSFRTLQRQAYNVWDTKVIAGHYRQLRRLVTEIPDDLTVWTSFQSETRRMNSFVDDVELVNEMTQNRLYMEFGNVKDSTFDDLIGFLHREIRRRRRIRTDDV